MTSSSERFRYALGIALATLAATGVVADLLGVETINPAYFGALFAAGFGLVPDAGDLCSLPRRVFAAIRP